MVRDLKDNICGYMACVSLASAPAFAYRDPLIGPWLAHARDHIDQGESVIWHAAVDFTGAGKVQAMLGVSGVLRCGATNPRFAYLPIDPAYPGAVAFATAIGAEHHTELDVEIGGMIVECYRLDYGEGGLTAFLRGQVYAELGLPAPDPTAPVFLGPGQIPAAGAAATAGVVGAAGLGAIHEPAILHPALACQLPRRQPRFRPSRSWPETARAGGSAVAGAGPSASAASEPPQPAVDLQTVRDALKNFRVPRDLARSPLAVGDTVAERAESVRQLIRQAAQEAFGDNENEKLLYSVLVAGYLEPMRSHEEAANKLLLSRAAYFRRLRTAVERLAEHLAEQVAISPTR